jgi:hypothetical protein
MFNKILSKLGLKKSEEEAAPVAKDKVESKPSTSSQGPQPTQRPVQTQQPQQSKQPVQRGQPGQRAATTAPPVVAKPAPMEMVDVMSKLETMARGTNLDWKVSIVDLLKVLGIDSSLEARKELATELGAAPDVMADNVKMNVWLHKTVLAKIAENGGNVPKELLD